MTVRKRMSRVVIYRNTDRLCFCQIQFANGERALVSVAGTPEPGIRVVKLLFRVIPKTVWEYSAAGEKDPHNSLIDMLTDEGGPKADHPLDAIIMKLCACRSCGEAVGALLRAEERFRSAGRS